MGSKHRPRHHQLTLRRPLVRLVLKAAQRSLSCSQLLPFDDVNLKSFAFTKTRNTSCKFIVDVFIGPAMQVKQIESHHFAMRLRLPHQIFLCPRPPSNCLRPHRDGVDIILNATFLLPPVPLFKWSIKQGPSFIPLLLHLPLESRPLRLPPGLIIFITNLEYDVVFFWEGVTEICVLMLHVDILESMFLHFQVIIMTVQIVNAM